MGHQLGWGAGLASINKKAAPRGAASTTPEGGQLVQDRHSTYCAASVFKDGSYEVESVCELRGVKLRTADASNYFTYTIGQYHHCDVFAS